MMVTTIGEYELVKLLGTGAAGEVFLATCRSNGEQCALKLLSKSALIEQATQQRFIREAAILQNLDHPNVVRCYDCGIHDDRYYLVLELVESGTLKDVLRARGSIPWRETAECGMQIARALEHAHQRGIIHRDLKPANLFLSPDGLVKLGDFGVARDETRGRLTLDGQTVGTVLYISPEQARGAHNLTGASDLYALGCLLYEMIVGTPPFNGTSMFEVMEQHMVAPVTDPCGLAPACDRRLGDLILRLLAKSPEDRPLSAAEVANELGTILAGRTYQPHEPIPTADADRDAIALENIDQSSSESDVEQDDNLTERLLATGEPETREISWRKLLVSALLAAALITVAVLFNKL